MKKYLDWGRKEHSLQRRIFALALAGILFVIIIPTLLVYISSGMDRWLQIPGFHSGIANIIAGVVLVAVGGFLAIWSIEAQMTVGSGTPLPMLPTVRLVVKAPFTYCRNPMTLGTYILYTGVAVLIGSWSALVIVLLLTMFLFLYIKTLEEKELEARFGAEYLSYKRKTPFMIPRLRAREEKE